ncbi:hypothetical protein [Alteromonas facilis]|uniref:hypothetical protein n=1 Tax=Alteromonas facilis TaxID=2048004 RepID=UPI000C290993|nr:hypothetical protein [Alteromonas facilis]
MHRVKTKHYQIWQEDRVVIVIISGAWNEVITQQYCKALKTISSDLTTEPWAILTYLDEWLLSTPQSEAHILELQEWCKHNNVACNAVVYAANPLKDYQVSRMLKLSNKSEVFKHFTQQHDALQWLATNGFDISDKDISLQNAG